MFKENTKYYTVIDLINSAISKSFDSNSKNNPATNELSFHIINDMTYNNLWNAFTKWCESQTEQGYLLNIYRLGAMFHVSDNKYEGVSLKLSESILRENDLRWDESKYSYDKIVEYRARSNVAQVQKLNYCSISSDLDLPKVYVQTGLNNMFNSIGYLLSSSLSCVIELGVIGNIVSYNKVVYHIPCKLKKDTAFNKKTTIKTLLRKNKQINQVSKIEDVVKADKMKLKALEKHRGSLNYEKTFEQIPDNQLDHNLLEKEKKYDESRIKISMDIIPRTIGMRGLNDTKSSYKPVLIPLRERDWNMKSMLDSTFQKLEKKKRVSSPIIFNAYSNTKAAPFTSEKTQIPISHRIGSFYTIPLQSFIINKTSKSIVRLFDEYFTKYKMIMFDIPATAEEEYLSLFSDDVSKSKVVLRKETYERYKHYINYIPDDCISEIKEKWLIEIVKMCLRAYDLNGSHRYSDLLDGCVREIVKEYKIAIKKSVLDYILKHPEQREKLGIAIPFRKLKEYAEGKVTRPSDNNKEWKDRWRKSKFFVSSNLLIICDNITKILKYYVKNLQNTNYLDLNESEWIGTVKLTTFIENQKAKMELQNKLVCEDWKSFAENILRENKIYKDQLVLYFKSVSGLMSTQLRQLIINSLNIYNDFISCFKQDKYYTPQEIFENQFNPQFPFQKSFIVVEIVPSHDGSKFAFSDDLELIYSKLTLIVDDLICCSEDVERPDNMFIKSINKRNNLWKVSEDSEVTLIKDNIDMILKENQSVIENSLSIYDPFIFVLNEYMNIENVKSNSNTKREDIKKLISHYEEKLKILREDMPDSLYLNLIKIDCSEINRLLVRKLYDYINDLLKYVNSKHIISKAKEIYDKSEKLRGELTTHAQDEVTLAMLENIHEKHKTETLPQLETDYGDFLQWVFFYLDYDIYPIHQDNQKDSIGTFDSNINLCYFSLISIEPALESMLISLKEKKNQFDIALNKTRGIVMSLITKLKEDVDEAKTNAMNYLVRDDTGATFLNLLKDYEKRTHDANSSLKNLVRKEELLQQLPTEDDRVDQCTRDLDSLITYMSFYYEYKLIQSELDSLEIKYMDFVGFFSLIEKSNDLFEASLQKLPQLRNRIKKFQGEFDNFRSTVELAKLIFGLVEILKFDHLSEENPQLFEDNSFYCRKFCEIVFPEIKDFTKSQEFLKNIKFKEIFINKPNFLIKTQIKPDLEKLVQDWETVKQIYDIVVQIANDVDIEIKTEKYKDKKYYVIAHSSFEDIRTVLEKGIRMTKDNISLIKNSNEQVNILLKAEDYKNKLIDLLKVIENLENTQLTLEDLMNKRITFKNRQEIIGKMNIAENNFSKLIISYITQHPKLMEVSAYLDILQENITSVNQILSEVTISLES